MSQLKSVACSLSVVKAEWVREIVLLLLLLFCQQIKPLEDWKNFCLALTLLPESTIQTLQKKWKDWRLEKKVDTSARASRESSWTLANARESSSCLPKQEKTWKEK